MNLVAKLAVIDEEVKMAKRLRHKIYSRAGYINPNDFPDGLEQDKYDQVSRHFLILEIEKKICVGTTRLVMDTELGFPLEEKTYKNEMGQLRMELAERGRTVQEGSRIAVLEEYRKGDAWLLIMGAIYFHSIETGITDLVWSNPTYHKNQYEKAGARVFGEKVYKTPKIDLSTVAMHWPLDEVNPDYKNIFDMKKKESRIILQ